MTASEVRHHARQRGGAGGNRGEAAQAAVGQTVARPAGTLAPAEPADHRNQPGSLALAADFYRVTPGAIWRPVAFGHPGYRYAKPRRPRQ